MDVSRKSGALNNSATSCVTLTVVHSLRLGTDGKAGLYFAEKAKQTGELSKEAGWGEGWGGAD